MRFPPFLISRRGMGNCQAAEAATVVIQRPGGGNNVERIYWSVSAGEVMSSNPGHYVAMVVASTAVRTEGGGVAAVKQLKLLRPDDTLLLGHVYRLIRFEDVLKEFAAKKSAKLGRLLKQIGVFDIEPKKDRDFNSNSSNARAIKETGHQQQLLGSSKSGSGTNSKSSGRRHSGGGGGGHWRPALHTIAELGT